MADGDDAPPAPFLASDAPEGRWWHAEKGSVLPWWFGFPVALVLWLVTSVTDPLGSRELVSTGRAVLLNGAGVLVLTGLLVTAIAVRRHRDRWVLVDDRSVRAGLCGQMTVADVVEIVVHRGIVRTFLAVGHEPGSARAQLTWWDPAVVEFRGPRRQARHRLLIGTSRPRSLIAAVQHARRRAGLPRIAVHDPDVWAAAGVDAAPADLPVDRPVDGDEAT